MFQVTDYLDAVRKASFCAFASPGIHVGDGAVVAGADGKPVSDERKWRALNAHRQGNPRWLSNSTLKHKVSRRNSLNSF